MMSLCLQGTLRPCSILLHSYTECHRQCYREANLYLIDLPDLMGEPLSRNQHIISLYLRLLSSGIYNAPHSPFKVKALFGGTCRSHLKGRIVSQARNHQKAGIKQGSISSETSVYFQRTARLYIPEDGNVRNHRCENPKS